MFKYQLVTRLLKSINSKDVTMTHDHNRNVVNLEMCFDF